MPGSLTKSPTAVFKLFGNRSGAMLFDDAATTVAKALNIETTPTVENAPSLQIKPEQFDQAESALEAKGFTVFWKQSSPAIISVGKHDATIYGQAAVVASKHLDKPYGETEKGVPKLKIDRAQVDELKQHLTERGFKVEIEERESTYKPKVVFRESEDDRYLVFDRSAENLAQALQRQSDRTPGGRAMLEFDRSGYKQIQQQYGDALDISTKQLKLEATIATYDGNHGKCGVITGAIASEVAGQLGLETGRTRVTTTGSSMVKLNLTEAQIDTASQLLQEQGYQVDIKPLDFSKVANVSHFNDGSVRLFGTPAEEVASALNLSIEQTRNSTPMLRVSAEQREAALETLKNAGYEIRDSQYQPQPASDRASPTRAEPQANPKADSVEGVTESVRSAESVKNPVAESVSYLVQFFQGSQLPEIEQRDSGLKVQFNNQTLTAQTPEGRVLSASLETRRIQSSFAKSDLQNLVRLASEVQKQSQLVQSEVEIG